MNKLFKLIVILIVSTAFVLVTLPYELYQEEGYSSVESSKQKTQFSNNNSLLYINGNLQLENYSISGNGTINNPFLIMDDIFESPNTTYGIYIENTNKYLLIINCSISAVDYGIVLKNVSSISFKNCKVFNHKEYGLVISSSKNVTGTDSEIHNNDNGIKIQESIDILLEKNFISMNYLLGIFLINSFSCDIIDNYIFSNQYGIKTENSIYNKIFGNNLEYHENAIHLSHSNFNIIMNNNGADNLNEIIEKDCQNNLFENNFPQQEIDLIITEIDVTIIIVFSISFFSIAYMIMNAYRYRKLSKSPSL